MRKPFLFFAVLLLLTTSAFAQWGGSPGGPAPEPRKPNTYGPTDLTSVFVSSAVMTPYIGGAVAFSPSGGNQYTTSGFIFAHVNLPNGAQIVRLEIQGCDNSAVGEIMSSLYTFGPAGAQAGLAFVSSDGPAAAGCTWFASDLAAPETVDNRNNSYIVTLQTTVGDDTANFNGIRVYYRLQMGPAPATQSFLDVSPAQVAIYQAVENLKASGITAGCGDGTNFCPNANVTRGQMAIFLARALGLHWPN